MSRSSVKRSSGDCLTSTRDKLALETELTFLISDSTQLAKDVEGIDLSDLTIDPGLCDLTAEVELSEKEVEILTRSLDLTQTDDRKKATVAADSQYLINTTPSPD
jgi:hypothetical protein